MNTDNNLIIFKAIANFTQALADEFGKKQHSLALYSRLINKTTLAHDTPIKKHIAVFTEFCINNREAILNKNPSLISKEDITYSERVFINMKHIFNMADADTKTVIWQHLLTISALVDSSSNAKEILRSQTSSQPDADFLEKIVDKIQSTIKPDTTPLEAMSSIMSSGVITDLMSGLNSGMADGSLNIPKLLASVQSMVKKLASKNGNSKETKEAVNMINNLIGMLGKSTDGGSMPDISSMMSMVMGMAGGAGGAAGGGAGTPDISSMMNMFMGMAGGAAGGAAGSGTPDLASMMSGLMNASGEQGSIMNNQTSTISEITDTEKINEVKEDVD